MAHAGSGLPQPLPVEDCPATNSARLVCVPSSVHTLKALAPNAAQTHQTISCLSLPVSAPASQHISACRHSLLHRTQPPLGLRIRGPNRSLSASIGIFASLGYKRILGLRNCTY